MKHDVYISVLLTKDEHAELTNYMTKYMSETGERIKQSPMIRQLLLDTIRSKNIVNGQDNKPIENKQETLPMTPHDEPSDSTNPYSDLHF